MEISTLLLPFVLTLFVVLLLKTMWAPRNLPPGPRPFPSLPTLLHLARSPHAALARISRRHGPLFSLRLGSTPIVVASTPAAADHVLRAHDRALSGRHIVHAARVTGFADNSVVWSADCGDHWLRCRAVLRSDLLGRRSLDAQSAARERKVAEMVEFIKGMEGREVEIGEAAFPVFLNLFGELLFSEDLIGWGTPGAREKKARFCKMVELSAVVGLEDYFPTLSRFDVSGRRAAAGESRHRVLEMWEGFIKDRRDCGKDSDRDFLDVLIAAGFSDVQISVLALDLIVAGSDTSTATIEWAMAELIKNPEIMSKLSQELDEEVGEGAIKDFHLPRLSYLQACVKETLRLHSPVPLLPHRALEPCNLMGYDIPQGCQVMVNVWAVGRDPEAWEDPTAFVPERFAGSDADQYGDHDFKFLPFGGGRRGCPGAAFATRVVPLVLGSLVHDFEWRMPDGMSVDQVAMDEKFGLTLKKDPPLLLVPRARR